MNVNFHLTLGCNLRCTYCFAGTKVDKSMTSEIAQRGLDFAARTAAKTDGFLNIHLFGGEPLMKFDLIKQLVDKAPEYRSSIRNDQGEPMPITFNMTTNGTLFTDDIIEYFKKHEVLYTLSLDGDRTSQDMHRKTIGNKGTFEIVMSKLPKILAANPYIKVNMVVTPETAFNVDNSIRFLHGSGIRYIVIRLDHSSNWDIKSFKILKEQYQKISKYYINCYRQGRKIYISIFDDKIRAHALHKVRPYGIASPCVAGDTTLSIAPSGRIYPCVEFVKDDDPTDWIYALGNVFDGIDPERKNSFRSCLSKPPAECDGCAFFARCYNYCACANSMGTGDPAAPSPFLCEHERLVIPLADSIAATLWRERNKLFVDKFYDESHPLVSYLDEVTAKI